MDVLVSSDVYGSMRVLRCLKPIRAIFFLVESGQCCLPGLVQFGIGVVEAGAALVLTQQVKRLRKL